MPLNTPYYVAATGVVYKLKKIYKRVPRALNQKQLIRF